MSALYERFLPLVPDGGAILDAGCGSGRDALAFQRRGYEVTAIDASQTLCKLASAYLGKTVECMRFSEIAWQGLFEAVWACASLLHVPRKELPAAISMLLRFLKPGGVMYCSFKSGSQEREQGGRHFTDMTGSAFKEILLASYPAADVETWITTDKRPDRNERWLNAIVKL